MTKNISYLQRSKVNERSFIGSKMEAVVVQNKFPQIHQPQQNRWGQSLDAVPT